MRFESLVGRRHLWGGGRLRLRLTALIAIASVAVGVAALITVIAVIDGLDARFQQSYIDLMAHIEVLPMERIDEALIENAEEIISVLENDPRVVACAPLIRQQAFLLTDRDIYSQKTAVEIRGIDPERTRRVANFIDQVEIGTGVPGPGQVVLGARVAEELMAMPGRTVWAVTKFTIDALAIPHFRQVELRVAGLMRTGIPDLDSVTIYTDYETARRAFVLPRGAATAIQIRIADPHQARAVAQALARDHADLGVRFRSWDETNAEFFHALQLEKLGTFVMLLMIVLVASFNIVGTLVMIVTERTREIGILKTMGASDAVVRRIFLRGGVFIGLLGTAIGFAGGMGLCYLIGSVIPLPQGMFIPGMTHLPVVIDWPTVIFIVACSMGICLVASVIPAQTAARLDPVEALRRD